MNRPTTFNGGDKKPYTRWTKNERIQHWIMAVSFILLVWSGFALKYPDAWWVRPLIRMKWFADMRGILHRTVGVVFLLLGGYHVAVMLATRRGRQLIRELTPGMRDLRDFRQNMAYNFGLSKQRPVFSHFSYMEKAEYLALIWGAVIMGVTGLLLWFESFTLSLFPRWSIDLFTVIHLYEAWLATLAIIVWHFYYVMINPDIYPLNTSMVDGKLTEDEMQHEYFREWQELQSEDEPQAETTEDTPDKPS